MWGRSVLFALALAALAAPAAQAASPCVLEKDAELPVTMIGLRPTISARINGQDVRLLVDSGAFFSMIQPEAAKRLGLRMSPLPGRLSVTGVGGQVDAEMTTAKAFTVGPFTLPQVDFITGQAAVFDTSVVGLLGQNFLRAFDVEYDLANGVIRLFQPKGGCDGPRAYWGGAYSVMPIEQMTALDPHLVGRVAINGKSLHATFDTGAAVSVLSLHAASRAGLTPQSPGVTAVGMTGGLGANRMAAWAAPIDTFALDGETITRTRLLMADLDLNGGSDMLIGADFFLAHRVYVATTQRKIYITYNGGPVFSLGGKVAQPIVRPAEGGEGAPTDADGFARRAAASMARQDFAGALADFNHAIELDQTSAKLFHDRAMTRLALR